MIWTTEFIETLTLEEKIEAFEALRDSLNLKTITEFSRSNDIAYNTAKTKKPFVKVCNTKYLPDAK